jgi:hypothetical protein
MRIILLTTFLLIPLLTNAQFIKGDKFVGGTFRLSSQTPINSNGGTTYEVNTFYINPLIGFLVSEKFAIGGQIGYSYYNTKYNKNQPSSSEYNSSGFSLGLIAKRYFDISDKFLFSINGVLDFNRGTEKSTTNTTEDKTQSYQLGATIQPSFTFFPSPKWGFEASIGALSYNYSRNLSNDSGQSYFNFHYETISLGLYYYFRRPSE